MAQPTFIDLFAGAGGLSEGLAQAGYHGLFASEIRPECMATYRLNHPGALTSTADVRTVSPKRVRRQLGLGRGDLDLLAGGPPCQGFSIYAPVRTLSDDRNHLFKEYLRFVEEFKPRAILVENVPGLVSFQKGQTLQHILTALSQLGYQADVRIMGAAHYGIPQTRWRTIIIGLKDAEVPPSAFPPPRFSAPAITNFTTTHAGRSLVSDMEGALDPGFTTVHDAIGDLPPLRNGERGSREQRYLCPPFCEYQKLLRAGADTVLNHEAARLAPINMLRLEYIRPGGNWTAIPPKYLPKGMRRARQSDHTKRYGRVEPSGLASTILTKCDPHWGAYIHYAQDRVFTVREAARIQSFPDRFIFTGSLSQQYAQVGNAVPPLLAKAIGLALKAVLAAGGPGPARAAGSAGGQADRSSANPPPASGQRGDPQSDPRRRRPRVRPAG